MKKLIALLLLAPVLANADLIQIEATGQTSANGTFRASDFVIVFDDLSGDGIFQLDELVSFSGMTFFFVPDAANSFITVDGILEVPSISGVSEGSEPQFLSWGFRIDTVNGGFIDSGFDGRTRLGVASGFWNYAVSRVPEPGTLALLGIGLAGIGLGRRRRSGR